jgi:hypothetical protein
LKNQIGTPSLTILGLNGKLAVLTEASLGFGYGRRRAAWEFLALRAPFLLALFAEGHADRFVEYFRNWAGAGSG